MGRVRLVLTIALCAAGAIIAGAQQPVFRSSTHTVSIYATVVDRAGRLVPDLTKDDFEVYDNGRRRDLAIFANDVQPITIVVMLDRSGSVVKNFDLVQRAAEVFIDELLPSDQARLGSFSRRIEIDPETFTSDRAALVRILREKLQGPGPTPLWDATAAAMTALAGQTGRRVVLIFTDGKDTPGWLGTVSTSFEEVRQRAEREEIMVYGIGLADPCDPDDRSSAGPRPAGWRPSERGGWAGAARLQRRGPRLPIPGGLPPRLPIPIPAPIPGPIGPRLPGSDYPPRTPPFTPPRRPTHGCEDEAPDPELRTLAEDGGGGYFELSSGANLASTFARVADELHHQYALAFTTTDLDGTVHTLDVRVRRPDLTARARHSYFAAREDGVP